MDFQKIGDIAKDVGLIAGACYSIVSIIIRATPTPKDDKILGQITPWYNRALWVADKVFTASRRK